MNEIEMKIRYEIQACDEGLVDLPINYESINDIHLVCCILQNQQYFHPRLVY